MGGIYIKYLKITNNGSVGRKFFELIGASDKRAQISNFDIIGNKGSGAKLAVIPTLRMGLDIAISSSDETGEYILSYSSQDVKLGANTVKQIVFNYLNNERQLKESFPSQLTLDAFRDWDNPIGDDDKKIFKALREYICNAWDEDKKFTMEEVSGIAQAKPGMTSVYISITDEIREVLNYPVRYFKILSECQPLYSDGTDYFSIGKIYPKSETGVTRFFSQGILVDCKKDGNYKSVFDYSLNSKYLLSEERIIKELTEFIKQIGELILKIDNPELIRQIFRAMAKNEGEEARIELWAIRGKKQIPNKTAELWRSVWKNEMGKKAAIAVNNTQVDEDARNMGFQVIRNLSSELVAFLKHCGVTFTSDVAAIKKEEKKPDFELVALNETQQGVFDQAHALFLRYYSKAKKIPVFFYRPLSEYFKNFGGHCGEGLKKFKEIWIAESSLGSIEDILTILIHESRHCILRAEDYDREFTQGADKQLVKFILANPNPPSKDTWRAQVIPKRGILIPSRYIGKPVHILVNGQELRIKIGKNKEQNILNVNLPTEVNHQVSQNRNVVSFRKFGCVSLPDDVIQQLPSEIILGIA